MKGQEGGSLSRVAKELLAAERSAVEPAELKERALTRARRALDDDRASAIGLRAALRRRALPASGRARRVVIAIAATLAVAGLAMAGVALQSSTPLQPRFLHRTLRSSLPGEVTPKPRVTSVPSVGWASAPTPEPSATPSVERRGARATTGSQYAMELQLLEPARRGVARGDYASALEAIARHRREFPRGLLAEERAALQVRALRGAGRTREAEAAAAAFRQRYPRSALLGGAPTPPPRGP